LTKFKTYELLVEFDIMQILSRRKDTKYSYLGERDMESSGGVGLQVKGIAKQSSPSRNWARKTKQI
jgi:hypothetical protein